MTRRTMGLTLALCGALGLGIFGGQGLAALRAQLLAPVPVQRADHAALLETLGADRVLFTVSTCPYCGAARDWLQQRDIAFVEQVIDRSPAAQQAFDTLGEAAVPVLVGRDRRVRGFVPEAYAEWLLPGARIGEPGNPDAQQQATRAPR